jgi:hypothetical protein
MLPKYVQLVTVALLIVPDCSPPLINKLLNTALMLVKPEPSPVSELLKFVVMVNAPPLFTLICAVAAYAAIKNNKTKMFLFMLLSYLLV